MTRQCKAHSAEFKAKGGSYKRQSDETQAIEERRYQEIGKLKGPAIDVTCGGLEVVFLCKRLRFSIANIACIRSCFEAFGYQPPYSPCSITGWARCPTSAKPYMQLVNSKLAPACVVCVLLQVFDRAPHGSHW
jgi:hypothetical protein